MVDFWGLVRQLKEVETISLLGAIFLLFAHGSQYSLKVIKTADKVHYLAGVVYIISLIFLTTMISIFFNWVNNLSQKRI